MESSRAGRPRMPVVIGGTAAVITDMKTIKRFHGPSNDEYQTNAGRRIPSIFWTPR